MKFFRIKSIICNSNFTKSFIDKEYNVNSIVIYPPVDIEGFKASKKENKILYVGRFSQLTQSKNQHILVKAFKNIYDSGNKSWKLVLAGGSEVGADEYVSKLREQAKGYPISIKTNPTFTELKSLYSTAKIFWSAVGYDVDAESEPLRVEHFGMTVVEAMAAKCIPIIPNKGGYVEIINESNGMLWEKNIENLISKTNSLINDKNKLNDIAKNAQLSVDKFSIANFEAEFSKIIK